MRTHLSVFASLLVTFSMAVRAQDSVASSQAEMRKWIETTDAQWQAAFKREITDTQEAELNKLKLQYQASIEAAITKASGAGDLDGSLALRTEQTRFASANLVPGKNPIPDKDGDADSPGVRQLRGAMRIQLARLEKEDAARIKALHEKYDQMLARVQTQLTQQKRLDDALLVKNKREDIAVSWFAKRDTYALSPPAIRTTASVPPSTGGKQPGTVKEADVRAILGKWTMRPENNAPVERELKADGTIIKTGGGTGKWVIEGSSLILRYPDGSHSTFELPARNGKLIGKGLWGEKITAERK